jgi:predicted Rossmann-fold nucleotide-binding protein
MEEDAKLPFNPMRASLYGYESLFDGFDVNNPASYAASADLQIYSYFMRNGKNPTSNSVAATLEALHDNSISLAIQKRLSRKKQVIAIMGGHTLLRADNNYKDVASLSWELVNKGFLVTSGGGPGAMEATHLGALFANASHTVLDAAIAALGQEPKLPDAAKLADEHGKIDPVIAAALHKWFSAAYRVRVEFDKLGLPPGESLAIPTWLYGFEPTSPFATHIGKYFQNSVREDGLVTIATHGIIYTPGKAGTVQEIFQDVAQNYYGQFCPMVFLKKSYWLGNEPDTFPVRPLVEALLGSKPEYASRVLFADDVAEAVSFLGGQSPK